jgi:hypothetical protein
MAREQCHCSLMGLYVLTKRPHGLYLLVCPLGKLYRTLCMHPRYRPCDTNKIMYGQSVGDVAGYSSRNRDRSNNRRDSPQQSDICPENQA